MSISGEMVASFAARDPSPCRLVCFTAWQVLFFLFLFFFFFAGVYFTFIDPSNDPKKILLNNYDDAGQVVNSQRLWAKLDWVIELKVDRNKVKKVKNSNRDVYLYEGDVHLENCQYSIYKNPNTKDKDWATLFFSLLRKPCETWPRA